MFSNRSVTTSPFTLKRAIQFASISAIALIAPVLSAQPVWDGSNNNNWGTGPNWTPSGVPGYASDIIFNDTPGSDQSIRLGGTRQINELIVNSQYDYEIYSQNSGQLLVFTNAGAGVNFGGTGDLTISSNMALSASTTTFNNTSTGDLFLNGNITSWGGNQVNFSGSGDTTFSGSLGGGIDVAISGTGNNTFDGADFLGGATISISGGTNLFDVGFGGNTTLNITGGDTIISEDIGGGPSINVNVASGGLSLTGAIGGGANIVVDQGQLALSGAVGNGAGIVIESGGTLLLEDGVSIGGGSNVELDGGTLAVSADNVSLGNLTLTSNSTIDLLNDPTANIDLGTITGGGTVNIINYVSSQQIYYNPGSSTINVPTQILFYGNPAEVINGNELVPSVPVAPVPEPGTMIGGAVLTLLSLAYVVRRRRSAQKQATVATK